MIVVSVIYPAASGAKFDYGYYMATHIPLVRRLWSGMGLREVRVLKGSGTPDGGPPPYLAIALLTFASGEALKAASAEHGEEIFGDVPKFTDISPVVQVNEALD